MVDKTFKLEGGLSYVLSVPATVAEFCSMAEAGEESVLNAAISEIVYRSCQADVREALCDKIEEVHNIARGREAHATRKDDEGNPVLVINEPAGKFIARAAGELKVKPSDFQPLLDAIMEANSQLPAGHKNRIVFDPKKTEPAPRKPAKTDLEFADKILKETEDKRAKILAKICSFLGREQWDQIPDQETLAWVLRDYRIKWDEQQKQSLLAE